MLTFFAPPHFITWDRGTALNGSRDIRHSDMMSLVHRIIDCWIFKRYKMARIDGIENIIVSYCLYQSHWQDLMQNWQTYNCYEILNVDLYSTRELIKSQYYYLLSSCTEREWNNPSFSALMENIGSCLLCVFHVHILYI